MTKFYRNETKQTWGVRYIIHEYSLWQIQLIKFNLIIAEVTRMDYDLYFR